MEQASDSRKRKASVVDESSTPWQFPLTQRIFEFLDVPDLGRCARVSREFQTISYTDDVWKGKLRKLLVKLLDGAFYSEPKERSFWVLNHAPIKISGRPLRSTNFYTWNK